MSLTPEALFQRHMISFSAEKEIRERPETDLLVVFSYKEQEKTTYPSLPSPWSEQITLFEKITDFKADEGEVLFLYQEGGKEKRLALVGLGEKDKLSIDSFRKAYASLATQALKKNLSKIAVLIPLEFDFPFPSLISSIADGIFLGAYSFNWHKGSLEESSKKLSKLHLIGVNQEVLPIFKQREMIAHAVYMSQDLINGNADLVTPSFLGKCATLIPKKVENVQVKVWNKKEIEEQGWGLLLAVNQGSPSVEPVVIQANYKGKGSQLPHTLLIGKGITYDTGGLNLKPTGSMETMKCDMSGAAIALSTLYAVAALQLPIELSVLIPSTENAISSSSFKPGDVYTSFLGKTVEITNTDAEGRLILADALAWGEKNLKPDAIIDLATLTGACAVALGPECAGLFSNDDKLATVVLEAGQKTGEKVWRMPLIDSYKEMLKSHVADLANCGTTREAGAITAALFLNYFVSHTPWAHLDIAGCAFTKQAAPPYPKHATGYGVRMLVDLFQRQL